METPDLKRGYPNILSEKYPKLSKGTLNLCKFTYFFVTQDQGHEFSFPPYMPRSTAREIDDAYLCTDTPRKTSPPSQFRNAVDITIGSIVRRINCRHDDPGRVIYW